MASDENTDMLLELIEDMLYSLLFCINYQYVDSYDRNNNLDGKALDMFIIEKTLIATGGVDEANYR